MTEVEITSRVEVPAEPDALWRLAMDWPRQGDWMLATRVSGRQGVGATVTARTKSATGSAGSTTSWCVSHGCVALMTFVSTQTSLLQLANFYGGDVV